jgi:hypothetical protein
VDWALRDDLNRQLGRAGEQLVADLEKQRLLAAGRPDLAARVVIVATEWGDGAGYDVLSFSTKGEKLHIEVKTTAGGKDRTFLLTANELATSERLENRYWLYRVFKAKGQAKIYRLQGPLAKVLELKPSMFQASAKR